MPSHFGYGEYLAVRFSERIRLFLEFDVLESVYLRLVSALFYLVLHRDVLYFPARVLVEDLVFVAGKAPVVVESLQKHPRSSKASERHS